MWPPGVSDLPSGKHALFSLSGEISRCVFFFNDTATTEIYTLSLHDALPISRTHECEDWPRPSHPPTCALAEDRKSTRLNSSHVKISYAVFCLKKKKKHN